MLADFCDDARIGCVVGGNRSGHPDRAPSVKSALSGRYQKANLALRQGIEQAAPRY
jgi:hypothetical protein